MILYMKVKKYEFILLVIKFSRQHWLCCVPNTFLLILSLSPILSSRNALSSSQFPLNTIRTISTASAPALANMQHKRAPAARVERKLVSHSLVSSVPSVDLLRCRFSVLRSVLSRLLNRNQFRCSVLSSVVVMFVPKPNLNNRVRSALCSSMGCRPFRRICGRCYQRLLVNSVNI